jgi:hypothetical protein
MRLDVEPVRPVLARIVENQDNRHRLGTPRLNIAPIEPNANGLPFVSPLGFIGRFQLKKYSPRFRLTGCIVGLHHQVDPVIVGGPLNRPATAEHETLDMIDAQVGNYVFPRPPLARPGCFPRPQGTIPSCVASSSTDHIQAG